MRWSQARAAYPRIVTDDAGVLCLLEVGKFSMRFFKRFGRNAAFQKTNVTTKPILASERVATQRLKAVPADEQHMVVMYPGDEVMWRHPQGYSFVVQVVEVRPDEVLVRLMRNGEARQVWVSPNSLSVTQAQARVSARRRAAQQKRMLPERAPAIAVGKTVRWHREGSEPVMARVLEVHWSDTLAKICPIGQRLTCWVDMPRLEVVA